MRHYIRVNERRTPANAGFGESNLSDWQTARASGTQRVVMLGDSWANTTALFTVLRDYYQGLHGDLGHGWISLGAHSDLAGSISYAGTWSTVDGSSSGAGTTYGVDVAHVACADASTPGKVTIGMPATTNIVIHYIAASGNGDFRWRVDSGAWTAVNTDNGGAAALATESISGLSGTFTFQIEITAADSNGVFICGLDAWNGTTGSLWHECGNAGCKADSWANSPISATIWKAGLTALDPDLVIFLTGTNDASQGIDLDTFETDLTTWATNIKAAVPSASVLFFHPSANGLNTLYKMIQYNDKARAVAVAKSLCFVDGLYYLSDYNYANDVLGYMADTAHPNTAGYTFLAGKIKDVLDL